MRVEIKLEIGPGAARSEIPWRDPGNARGETKEFLDLRENPRLIERLETARQFPALKSFLTAINEKDSFFFTARSKNLKEVSGSEQEFTTRLEIAFASESLNANRNEWARAAGLLNDLLTREPGGETLSLELTLRPCHYTRSGQDGYSMQMELRARGSSVEQAQMRCGLGLVRVQQALLFVSRGLRQKPGES